MATLTRWHLACAGDGKADSRLFSVRCTGHRQSVPETMQRTQPTTNKGQNKSMAMRHKYLHYLCGFGLLSLLCLLMSWGWVAQAQTDPPVHPDGWDLSFGRDGVVKSGCGIDTIGIWWGNFVLQPDDKILMFAACDYVRTLLRFLPDGKVDPTFGVNGRVTISNGSLGGWGIPALQSDGKILATRFDNQSASIVRYQSNGTVDSTFGDNGAASNPFVVDELLVQANDQVIATGAGNLGRYGVQRLTKDGTIDSTFNGAGQLWIDELLPKPTAEAEQQLVDAAVQSDGKLLLTVYTKWQANPFDVEETRRVQLVRLGINGTIDQTFATSGFFTATLTTRSIDPGGCRQNLLILPDGRLLVKTWRSEPAHHVEQYVRLTATGRIDPTFQPTTGCFDQILVDKLGYLLARRYGWATRILPDGGVDGGWAQGGTLTMANNSYNFIGFQQDQSLIFGGVERLARNLKSREHLPVATSTPTPVLEPTPTSTPTPLPPEQRSLALIYAVLDNNLGSEWTRLVNNIEAGAHPGVDVRLLIDGPATGDAYVYQIQPDRNPYCPTIENPTCDSRYREGFNYQRFFTEDTARPHALYQFLVDSFNAYPQAPQISLTIIGHGSGWGANALPAQPSIWRDQNDTLGGMLWDDHTGVQAGSRSLSTLALGQALHWATSETKRTLNLLYLDGCSMGMTEVAYELRNRADYLLASPNTDWATFAYDQLLPLVHYERNGRALGEAWLAAEAALMRSRTGYPFTLALTDLRQITPLATTVTAFANALQGVIPTQRAALALAYQQSDRFDSNYDAKLDSDDNYLDLRDFAAQVQSSITDTLVISHAQAVQTLLSSVVITVAQQNGSPWLAEEQRWAWRNLGGLSIYAPLHEDDAKRRIYYTKENLAWAADSSWDELLASFWAGTVNDATTADLPVCYATTQGCAGLANPLPMQPPQTVFLPMVWR